MAVVVCADATYSVAAYTKSADLVAGQYQNVGKGKIILVVYPSAIGMQATLSVGGITIVNDMPIPWFGTTGSMDLSAHVLVSQMMQGGKIEFYLRNTTVGALTNDYQLMFEPA